MGILDTDEDELDDWADAFGHLSLDEHREVADVWRLTTVASN